MITKKEKRKKEVSIFLMFESAKWLLMKLLGSVSGASMGIALKTKRYHCFGNIAISSLISFAENIKPEEWWPE